MSDSAMMDILDNFSHSIAKLSKALTEASAALRDTTPLMQARVKSPITSPYFTEDKKRKTTSCELTSRKRAKLTEGYPASSLKHEVKVKLPVTSTSNQRAKSLVKKTPSKSNHLILNAVEIPISIKSSFPSKKFTEQGRRASKPQRKLVTSHYFSSQTLGAISAPMQSTLPPAAARRRKRVNSTEKEQVDQKLACVRSRFFPIPPAPVAIKPASPSRRLPLTLAPEIAPPVAAAPALWWEDATVGVTHKQAIAQIKRASTAYYSLWMAKPLLIQGMF